jgi:Family of unknown function (DUF6062)
MSARTVLLADLEEALERPGCPICRMSAQSERRYLWNFLFEGVMNLSARDRVLDAWGFCPDHTWQLTEIEEEAWSGQSLSISFIRRAPSRLQAEGSHLLYPNGA